MSIMIAIDADRINSLDLSPVRTVIEKWLAEGAIAQNEQQLQFEIEYPREELDPREISEMFLMNKIFVLTDWFNQQGIPSKSKLMAMSQMFGYDLEDAFFDVIVPHK